MSAVLSPPNSFSADITLANGVDVRVRASTLADLSQVVGRLQPTEAANDANTVAASPKPAATPAATSAPAAAGNVPASTATPASAPAAVSGSAPAGDEPHFNYDDVKARVLKLSKVSREVTLSTLGQFTGVNGQPVDHGNKLQLPDYPAFIAAADKVLAAGAKA
jgi:hypothetical protein